MATNNIFVNLPVKDLGRTKTFFEALAIASTRSSRTKMPLAS